MLNHIDRPLSSIGGLEPMPRSWFVVTSVISFFNLEKILNDKKLQQEKVQ